MFIDTPHLYGKTPGTRLGRTGLGPFSGSPFSSIPADIGFYSGFEKHTTTKGLLTSAFLTGQVAGCSHEPRMAPRRPCLPEMTDGPVGSLPCSF